MCEAKLISKVVRTFSLLLGEFELQQVKGVIRNPIQGRTRKVGEVPGLLDCGLLKCRDQAASKGG